MGSGALDFDAAVASSYDQQGQTEPGPAVPVQQSFDFDAAVKSSDDAFAQDDALSGQWLKFRQENTPMAPERQTRVFRAAAALKERGQAPDLAVVSENLDTYEKQNAAAGAHWDTLLADHPALRDYLVENPHRQELVADDLKSLDGLSWAFMGVPVYAARHNGLEWDFQTRAFAKRLALEPKDEAIAGLQKELAKGTGADSLLARAWSGSITALPGLGYLSGAAMAGAGIGAAAAAPAAGALAVETAGIGAAAAEVTGATAGAAYGVAALTYFQTVGPAYIRLLDQGVRPEVAGPLADAEAGVTGLLFAGAAPALLARLGLPVAPAIEKIAAGTTAELAKRSLSKLVKDAAVKTTENVAHAALMMGAAGAVSQATTEAGGWIERGEDVSLERIASATSDSMISAVRDMALISAIAPFGEALGNAGETMRLAKDQQQLESTFRAATDSKLLERSPDEFQAFVATLSQRGLKKVYAPVADFRTYWEGRRSDPREVAGRIVGDDGAAYDQAVASGSDLALPMDRYLTVLGKTEHMRGLAADLKIRPDGRTPRQEQARIERRADELAKMPDLGDGLSNGQQLVEDVLRQSIRRNLEGNKQIADPDAVAAASAKVTAANFDRIAQQINAAADEGTEPINAYDVLQARARVEFTSRGGAVRAGNVLPDQEAIVEPASLAHLQQRVAGNDELLARDLYVDPVTGLSSALGDDTRAHDPADSLAFRFEAEGFKNLNDAYGHAAGDGTLRAMAGALKLYSDDGAKRGSSVQAYGSEASQAEEIASAMERAIDPEGRVRVTFSVAERQPDYAQTGEALGAAMEKTKAELRAGPTPELAQRGEAPIGLAQTPDELARVARRLAVAQAATTELRPEQLAHFAEQRANAFDAAYRDPSGLLNSTGWHRAREVNPKRFVASFDVRSFREANEIFGRAGADEILQAMAEKLAEWGGGNFDVARKGGDEFAAQSDDEGALRRWIQMAEDGLKDMVFYRYTGKDSLTLQDGLYIARGIAPDFDAADTAAREYKQQQGSIRGPEVLGQADFRRRRVEITRDHPDRPWTLVQAGSEGRNAARVGQGERAAKGARGQPAATDGASQGPPQVEGQPAGVTGGEPDGGGLPGAPPISVPERPGQGGSARGLREGSNGLGPVLRATRRRVDSSTRPQAWSKQDAFDQILRSVGGADGSPSEQADAAYRKFQNGNGKRPAPFPGGHFDTVNRALRDELGPSFKGVSGALEAFDLLTNGLRWDRMARAVDLLNSVPGLEGVDLPEPVHERLGRAEWLKEGGNDAAAKAVLEQPAYHGTPHRGIEKFSLHKIGSGTGSQVFGWGMYFASHKDVAEFYREQRAPGAGQTYVADVPPDADLLDYDKSLEEQPERVREILLADPVLSRVADAGTTGRRMYDRLVHELGDERTASLALQSAGIPGLRYLDQHTSQWSRKAGVGTPNYVVWDESKMPITGTLYQPGEKGARGSIEFELANGSGRPRRYTINLDGADESTAAHETFHMMTEVLHDVATEAGAPEPLKADYAALLKFMGHASAEERVASAKERVTLERRAEAGALSPDAAARLNSLRAKEERAAHAWEQYLMDGKAPSAELSGAFSQFAAWMARVYRGAGSQSRQFSAQYGEELGLTPEVRALFDRLLASDDQIERTRQAYDARPLSAARDAMTEDERREYDQLTFQAQSQARDEVLRELARDAKARSKLIEDHRAAMEEDAHRELDRQTVYRALSFLQDGRMLNEDGDPVEVPDWLTKDGEPLKLDARAVDALLGKGGRKTLPAKTWAKEGALPDDVATALGYPDGEALIRAMQVVEPRGRVVKRTVQEKIQQIYGPALIDDATGLFNEATAAANNEAAARKILLEMRAMRRQIDPNADPRTEGVTHKAVREAARRIVDGKRIVDLRPGTFRLAEQQAGKRAFDAALAGKIDRAVAEREVQLLNHYLYRNVREAAEKADHIRGQLEKKATDVYRAALGKALREVTAVDGKVEVKRDYLDGHDAIMAAIGIGQRKPQDFSLDDVVKRMDDEAVDVAFDAGLVGEIVKASTPYAQLTVPQAVEVDAAIKNIRAAANAVLEVRIGDKRAAVKEIASGIADELRATRPNLGAPPLAKTQVTEAERRRLTVQSFDGMTLNPVTLIGMMGAKAREFVQERYLTARAKRDAMQQLVLGRVLDAWGKMPEELQRQRFDVVPGIDADLPVPPEMAAQGARDRQWLWMAFLNMGNRGPKSNMERLLRPFKWSEQQMLDALGKHLKPEEATFLQSVLDITDRELWPEIAAKEERKTGLPPEKIEAAPIVLTHADGTTRTYGGGYFPARYDPDLAEGPIGEKQTEGVIAAFYAAGYERASTPKSHVRHRAANYANVLDLNWGVVTSHLAQVVHDVAFDEYVRDTARVLLDRDLRRAMRERLGPGRLTQIDAWLKAVANEFVDSVPKELGAWQKALNWFRSRAVAEAIGASFRVAGGDLTNAAIAPMRSIGRGGTTWINGYRSFAAGVANAPAMMAGRSAWRNEALARSPELRHRASEHTRQMQREVARIGQNVGVITSVRDRVTPYMWAMQEATDALSATQTWWASYNDATDRGDAEADAVKHADDTVRRNLPSHDLAEKSALLRDKRGVASVLLMQGWTNTLYNMIREEADAAVLSQESARRGRISSARAGWDTAAAAGRIAAVLLVAGAGGEWASGRGKDDDEDYGQWVIRKMLGTGASVIPIAGEAGQYVVDRMVTGRAHEFNPRVAPGAAVLQGAVKSIDKMVASDETDKRIWAAVDLVLMMMGGPGKQVSRSGSYITDMVQRDISPTLGQAAAGITGYQTAKQQGLR